MGTDSAHLSLTERIQRYAFSRFTTSVNLNRYVKGMNIMLLSIYKGYERYDFPDLSSVRTLCFSRFMKGMNVMLLSIYKGHEHCAPFAVQRT